jgi:hypothetical protein
MSAPAPMFFVCGCPKSGTTWVQLLLHHHPQISCAGESQLVLLLDKISRLIEDHNNHQRQRNIRLFGEIANYPGFPEIDRDDERWLYGALIARMLEKAVRKPADCVIGEKTPNLAEHLGWFHKVAPHAKFIHVIRDGRDVAVSGWHHLNRGAAAAGAPSEPFRDYALISAHVWHMVIVRARTAAAAMPGRYIEVRYEDLHAAPDATLDRLLRFLDVASSPELRRACIAAARFETLTGGRARGQEDVSAFLRKGIVGDWRNRFDAALNQSFLAIGGRLLAELGYPEGELTRV